jgi:hypothetical protein
VNGQQRKRPKQRRPQHQKAPKPIQIWRSADPLPDVEPIAVPVEVGALLRSLGDPPTIGGSVAPGHYFNAVIERAAAIAVALALSADLLVQPDED